MLARLPLRIVGSAVVAALAAMALSFLVTSSAMGWSFRRAVDGLLTVEDSHACEQDPTAWRYGADRIIDVYAYGLDGTPALPDAPALPADLPALELGDTERIDDGVLLYRRGSGACALFRVALPQPQGGEATFWVAAVTSTGASVFVVAGLAFTFAVRPIVRRIGRLRDAARVVGTDAYTSPQDTAGDALTEIGAVLDASDDRIRADRAELLRRQEALEVHLAEIAHDLRTPLASMQLAVEELLGASSASDRDVARRAMSDTLYVTSLVENLHEATRLRHGRDPTRGTVDLGSVVERVGERFRAVGRHRGVEVAVAWPGEPVVVACEPSFAERLLGNLVHNAVVHGTDGGHVAVVLERHRDGFRLVVEDDGPGLRDVTPADLAKRTFAGDNARARGEGLGVAIVNEIARRVGWTVTWAPREGGGLVVTVDGGVA